MQSYEILNFWFAKLEKYIYNVCIYRI